MTDPRDGTGPGSDDIDTLAWEFVTSPYGRTGYAGWPLDRRIHGFLKRRGLTGSVNDGDLTDSLVYRVMPLVSAYPPLRAGQ